MRRISGCLKKYHIYNLFRIFAMCDHALIYNIILYNLIYNIFIYNYGCNIYMRK